MATITVNLLGDDVINAPEDISLREAVAIANSNGEADTIVFDPALTADGPIEISLTGIGDQAVGNSALLVDSEITIVGSGAGVTIARDMSGPLMRLFHVNATGNLTLQNLMLTGGIAQGGRGGDGFSGGGGGGAGLGGAIFNRGSFRFSRARCFRTLPWEAQAD